MDLCTTASPTGYEDYAVYASGGSSWAVPYAAGSYALACQVKPKITASEFFQVAKETARSIECDAINHVGKITLKYVLDPQVMIAALKEK